MENKANQKKIFNIIFAGGSVPPMIGALSALENGQETHAYIERGRLYNGIEKLDNFYNIGFDTDKTKSIDKEPPFVLTAQRIRELKEKYGSCFFNLYTNESRALRCAAVAANAGLEKSEFHIYMMEDGIDTYKKLDYFYGGKTAYQPVRNLLFRITKREWFSIEAAKKVSSMIKNTHKGIGKAVKKQFDISAYSLFEKDVAAAKKLFAEIMSQNNHRFDNPLFNPNYRWPFPLSCLENFTYLLQSKDKVDSIISATENIRLMAAFGVGGTDAKTSAHTKIISRSLPQRVAALDEKQKEKYTTLVFDRFAENLDRSIGRKERAGQKAPDKKLIYISSRLDTMFVHPVTDKKYGIGGISATEKLPQSYAQLDKKYKSMFLFAKEEDYNIFRSTVKEILESTDAPEEMITKSAAKVFNIYADYTFTAKLLYFIYGERYDLILKNHPMTDIGNSADWREYYRIEYADGKILDTGRCLDTALQNFHSKDTTGRYTGYVNGGVSTENFEYLGMDISFAGQPSSVYNGLSDNAEIPFIITDGDADITGGGSSQVAYSAVSGRYLAGQMNYTDKNGAKQPAVFYNTGNILKACADIAEKHSETALADFYAELFRNWLSSVHPGAKDIDNQGFAVK